ncbi:MAG: hypothetical protein AABX30_01585 [Nanoarchaeota archaeon]
MKLDNRAILIIAITVIFLITILTKYYGDADIGDYADVAKFFAGEYNAKIRSSHSYFYGFISSPFVKLTGNFSGMKIMTLIWLILLILSIYYISGKDRKTLLLTITAPIFWYMAPIINPIQIASLFFLWGYYFLERHNEQEKIKHLFYSGIFFGLAWVFWDTVLHFGILLFLCFFWNKKAYHSFLFIIAILIGLAPRLILDQLLFNFPFYTILKSFIGGIVNSLWSGVIGSGHTPKTFVNVFCVLIIIPLYSWTLLTKENFNKDKFFLFFLLLSLLLILSNPQIRYTLIITPIILLKIGKLINEAQLKKYLYFSVILSILIIIPYLIQIKYSMNNSEFNSILEDINGTSIISIGQSEIIQGDLDAISRDFPNETFLVGPFPDDYAILARLYSGNNIKEFVSMQDYKLYLKNETILFKKEFRPISNINDRREIWIIGGISAKMEEFEFSNITKGIGINSIINLNNSEFIKKYNVLYISKINKA